MSAPASNFGHLEAHDAQLVRLGLLAERYFADDPNTCLIKLRQLAEALAQLTASHVGLFTDADEKQVDLLRRLQDQGILPRAIATLFHEVRKAGNEATHRLYGDHRIALLALKLTWQISVWVHRTFKAREFASGPFVPPKPPHDPTLELQAELDALREELNAARAEQATSAEQLAQLAQIAAQARQESEDRAFWEAMAAEADRERGELTRRLQALQAAAATQPAPVTAQFMQAAAAAATQVQLSEADTRKLIDEQLRAAGWEADSSTLHHGRGTRPAKGRAIAIAEWPTASGPADYVLFIGSAPVAVIEAKRRHVDVSAALTQASRYSRDFADDVAIDVPQAADGVHRIPLAFATNGRPFLRQLATASGTWFRDLREPANLARPLDGWYTPEGIAALLATQPQQADARLAQEPFAYGFALRPYQQAAIQAVEGAIAAGQRELLLAMATGTGKTKTCIALIYRLLKTRRFRRILFLVDRSALGVQATNAFKDTRMEGLQTFADTFNIKTLDEAAPDSDTAVHIATVQGMVQRVVLADDDAPAVDQYDCIVIDECHRGYLLDRELSDTELDLRAHDDYISKYRRVLDAFDAVKIGLTATPALHTTQIFGAPVYSYSYREAVIDGWLVDYEPPIRIETELATGGIAWAAGESVKVYNRAANQVELFKTPDALTIEVEQFNRSVITEAFNRVVCDVLAEHLDPTGHRKTLVFCVNDRHADLVVHLLKLAFQKRLGRIEDDAVAKITGSVDRPLGAINRFQTKRLPNVAVTVDLLTTGIDVPEICNLVFLRRVGSRILFDQMLGRATRLCPDIDKTGLPGSDKESFRVFDAVRLFEALQGVTAMQPVVVDPKIGFTQLAAELANTAHDDDARRLARDQFLAKLQRKRRHLQGDAAQDFEARAGMPVADFIARLRALPLADVAAWFTDRPGLGEVLDRKGLGAPAPLYLSEHDDRITGVHRGWGQGERPEDYLQAFTDYVRGPGNAIPALVTVLTRPRELTRRQLRELAIALDAAGFSEAGLATAWREATNQEIAARIVGFVRQAAIGDALLPYAERVDQALARLFARPPHGKPWTEAQRQWLRKIAAQTKANTLVDRDAIDDPDLLFKRDGGGFERLDRLFDGQLQPTLDAFNDAISAQPASDRAP